MLQSLPTSALMARAVALTPQPIARKVRGLSDRAVAWVFITPTILLLLAINIFPLIWTIRLSFTNYRANKPNAPGSRAAGTNIHPSARHSAPYSVS